ncbi:hypothetical protein CY652_08480 [Burkholderia sp. WAC0059]|nr:hypothetical protein CY652_08480 [Burkholderia sp. WAC0059]
MHRAPRFAASFFCLSFFDQGCDAFEKVAFAFHSARSAPTIGFRFAAFHAVLQHRAMRRSTARTALRPDPNTS